MLFIHKKDSEVKLIRLQDTVCPEYNNMISVNNSENVAHRTYNCHTKAKYTTIIKTSDTGFVFSNII